MMTRLTSAVMLALGLLAGAGATYWYLSATTGEQPAPAKMSMAEDEGASSEREVLYYRNPMGLPDTSPVPKKDSMGMDYIPVYADEDADDGTLSVTPA